MLADHARAMTRNLTKISVPQERGRFAQSALLQRDLEILTPRRSEAQPR
jgi:hypothetical protein